MTSDDKRVDYRGLDDGWTRAIEMVLTPIIAGAIGYALDRAFGTLPLLTILFVVAAMVAAFAKMYYSYDAEMRAHEAGAPWGGRGRTQDPRQGGS
jgi:F0F1-type ATP synthase assembly protein I